MKNMTILDHRVQDSVEDCRFRGDFCEWGFWSVV